jgi:hypothetical protein
MESRVQIVAIVVSLGLLGVVLELVRRRRLMERYSLLWLACAAILLALSIWRDGLERFADVVGVAYAPSAIFIVALGFILLLLLHFSLVISRLADQSKVLAQRLGLVQNELDEVRAQLAREREHTEPDPEHIHS